MDVCGQHFPRSILDRIQETVQTEPFISRMELSRRVCNWLNWRSPNGRLQEMSCRKALAKLNKRGVLNLPRQEKTYGFERTAVNPIEFNIPELCCALRDLGEVSVYPVSSRYSRESKIWFALLDGYHYLGSGPLCGAQIRYVVKSSAHGYLGALAFSSASWALKDRDQYIGWNEAARRANLHRLVSNDRFLILPTVKVKHLASHVLSLALSRLAQDWEQRYHIRPMLVETFVDPTRFTGACYKASNWTNVGDSAGRRDGIAKNIFLYPLDPRWREVLCAEPPIRLAERPPPEAPEHWAEEEFGTVRLYDNRLKERLYTIAQDFYNNPQASIPEACGSKAAAMGAYRFFQNPKVTMDVVLTAHTEATLERIKKHRVVLVPQDTTTLNYSTHPMTEGLGPVNNTGDHAIGLLLHDTLAFTEGGTPLGILDAQCWARDPQEKGKRYRRKELPIEQKESMKWLRSFRKAAQVQKLCPETMLVVIGDRESDIYELFLEASKEADGPKLLVRAEKTRNRKVDQEFLWDLMVKQEVAGCLKIHVPHRGSGKARDVWVDVRFAEVALNAPKRCGIAPSVTVWAVYVTEQACETIESPIEWMLLTTMEVKSFEDAQKLVEWYSGRWGIEVYHRTLKSGCRIKDRQLETADRLETCLGVDMVVAWRIYHLAMLGREIPEMPCTVFFKDIEWKALCCYVNKTPVPPEKPPSMREAVFMVGGIGGHLGRKGDGFPGTQSLWRGLLRLYTATEMYAIFTQQDYPHPMQSGP
ncbi:MAG: IS4 family transposase [Deltaproteobacteria bacterium]|nr:IS4 family transposase [Deltaproteobacteria bacterium]